MNIGAISTASRRRRAAVLAAALVFSPLAGAAELRCPPDGFDRPALRDLRKQHFDIADHARRSALARALVGCLSSPDSELRDKIGYEAYAYWRIGKALDHETWSFVESSLLAVLDGHDDKAGVARPFAALVLAEVVHADRDDPFLQKAQRSELLDAAIRYFTSVRDYRGFDATTGWRHGVAHGADLLGQLALEPDFGRAELDRILAALATQIVAHDDRVYVSGESERIAEAVTHVAGRDAHSIDAWKTWLAAATAPAPLARWGDAFDSSAGVAKHQNTMNFLLALYAELGQSELASSRELAGLVADAMQPLR